MSLALTASASAADVNGLCDGKRFALVPAVNDPTPRIAIGMNGAMRSALIDYGATQSLLWTEDRPPPGATAPLDLNLPGLGERPVPLRHADQGWAGRAVIGTDILSRLTVSLTASEAVLSNRACDGQGLSTQGFSVIDQAGFFAADPARINRQRPNVPVVFLEIGGVETFAQIDTGYDDAVYRRSIDINRPLFDRLTQAGVPLTPRAPIKVVTCDGWESRAVYAVADGSVTIDTDDGRRIEPVADVSLVLKAHNACGGIADMAEPAAQISASFLALFEAIVFDPFAQKVWIKPMADAP